MQEGCTAAFERLERDGCIIRRVIRPTSKEETDPCACSGAHGRLVRLALVALRLRIALRPAGMPRGCRRPLHARVAQARRALEAPVHPGLLATACCDRRHARLFLEGIGGGDAFPLCAEGDEEAGSTNGSGPWQGVKHREGGMVLGALRHGLVEVGNGLQHDAEWGDEGVPQENLGGEDAVIGGERHGPLDGLEAGVDDVNSAHVVDPEEPFQGGAARAWRGLEGRPAAEDVAQARRILLRQPWQDLWKGVFEGPDQAVRLTDGVTDQATAVCDELGAGTPGGAVGLQGLEPVTVCQEACDLECRIGGVVFGSARGQRCAVPGHRERIDGTEPEEILLAPCRPDGPFLACQAHRDRVSVESRAQGLDPRVDGFRAVCAAQERTPRSASGLEADIVCGIRPIAPDTGGKCFLRQLCPVGPPSVCESWTKGHACVRSATA
jgi:hypothetical protein